MKNQKGFTLIDLMFCIAGILVVIYSISIGYVIYHFVQKYW